MFHYRPEHRISAQMALAHSFLSDLPGPDEVATIMVEVCKENKAELSRRHQAKLAEQRRVNMEAAHQRALPAPGARRPAKRRSPPRTQTGGVDETKGSEDAPSAPKRGR